MSHAVVRGEAALAQQYLDGILNEILTSKNKPLNVAERKKINMAQILYHCLKKNPKNVFMINGNTGEVITNEQILKEAITLARVLIAKGVRGKTVTLLMRNHQRMTAMYFAVIFAHALPYMQDPNTTVYELKYYLKLVEPVLMFCDEEHLEKLDEALKSIPGNNTEVVLFEKEEHLKIFAKGHSDNVDDFEIPDTDPTAKVMLLPTSGSTGMPKAAIMTEQGLIAQLPGFWIHYTEFPKPTGLMMVLTTLQWMTFTMSITSGVVYEIPILMSPKPTTVEVVKDMLIKFRPTWTFFGPAFVETLVHYVSLDHFSSFESVTLLGAPATMELLVAIKEKLPKTANLYNGYGTTEAQGYVCLADKETPMNCCGKVFNIFEYKMIDDDGKEVGQQQKGELCLKGISCIPGYYKAEESYKEAFVDGWYLTVDEFDIDEKGRLYFIEKKKFSFKYKGSQVAPEEVEAVINAIPGVQECYVCGTSAGPAAAIVLHAGYDVTRKEINDVVNEALSDHKRLHGGIAFVSSLPHTHSGKIKRGYCKNIVENLLATGECF